MKLGHQCARPHTAVFACYLLETCPGPHLALEILCLSCSLVVSIRQGLRGGGGPQRFVTRSTFRPESFRSACGPYSPELSCVCKFRPRNLNTRAGLLPHKTLRLCMARQSQFLRSTTVLQGTSCPVNAKIQQASRHLATSALGQPSSARCHQPPATCATPVCLTRAHGR